MKLLLHSWSFLISFGNFYGEEKKKKETGSITSLKNKAGYTATPVACGWAGAIIEVSGTFGQEQ